MLTREQVGGSTWNCLPYLTNLSETYHKDTGQTYITGHRDNLRVSVSERQISIIGSLAKFFLGTNLHTLTLPDSSRAFEKMADILHLPIHKAEIRVIDIGHNIFTDYKPERYYINLGESAGYNRLVQPKSITYHTGKRKVKAYNKIAECKKSRTLIPDVYAGKNVLRFEVCHTERLPEQFNRAVITPDTLTDERFYMSMYDRWYKEYEAIEKIGLFNMDISKINTPKDYLDQLLILAVQEKGLDNVLHHIEVMKEQKVFKHPAYYSNLKRDLKKLLSSNSPFAQEPELLKELNSKMERVRRYYR
ncbi:hypothetical protein MKJ04_11805 [Pontibacter sp. E15-1]|uniref:phage/plasmid replication domain-containing protein n=1 Tax=Pontibacter sp. E15-1 TaxID=2919918 RepID=UPI001F4FE39F|nr:phage/plasmid replication protein [Pontibacter sp. E15-1]MCJ8165526.1 hypothetical protein [Pontibacter sp. E15-1]